MPRPPRSLAGQLMLASLVAMLLATGTAALVMSSLLWSRSGNSLLAAELRDELEKIGDSLRVDAAGRLHVVLPSAEANVYDAMPSDAAYRVLAADGRVLAASRQGPAMDALSGHASTESRRAVVHGAQPIVLQVVQGAVHRDGITYTLQVAQSERLVSTLSNHAAKLYLRAGTVTVALALLTFVVAVYLTIGRLLRPISSVSRAAMKIGPRTVSVRLCDEDLPSELLPLIASFNAVLTRLENCYRVQQEFLAAAAHELKTPLALLQAEIELSGAADSTLLLRDTSMMARKVHQLLHLAEVSEGHNFRPAPMRLWPVLMDAAGYLARLAHQHAVAIELVADTEATKGIIVEGDASAVFVLAKNLLENAIQHSPAGAKVRLSLHAAGFTVSDEGIGIAPEDRSRAFKRFWRGKTANEGGAGLGLAICMEICTAHGWHLQVVDHDGPGAAFDVDTGLKSCEKSRTPADQ